MSGVEASVIDLCSKFVEVMVYSLSISAMLFFISVPFNLWNPGQPGGKDMLDITCLGNCIKLLNVPKDFDKDLTTDLDKVCRRYKDALYCLHHRCGSKVYDKFLYEDDEYKELVDKLQNLCTVYYQYTKTDIKQWKDGHPPPINELEEEF